MTLTEDPPLITTSPARSARRTLFEILAVISLTIIPSLIYSTIEFYFPSPPSEAAAPISLLLGQFLSTFRFTIPLLFIMYASGKNFRHFGFTRLEPWDVLFALGILIAAFIFHMIVWTFLGSLAPSLVEQLSQNHEHRLLSTFAQVHGDAAILLLIPACLLVGFTEELIFRAYLLTRLTDLTGSKYQALFLTTILFAFVHIYQGAIGIVSAASMAALYGTIFLFTRRFWPLAIAHALNDFIAFLSL